MDKDKSSDIPGPCSWMEMHQFIGDLITSGNASKDQTDVLNAAWGLSGPGGVTLGFKAASLEPLQHPPAVGQDKTADPGRHVQIQRRGQTRDRREDVHHACTCPGCPYSSSSSSSPPSFETLKPRQPPMLPGRSQPKDLSSSAPMSLSICIPDTTASQTATTSGRLQRESADRGTRSPDQNSEAPPSRQALSGLSVFPCLCCHRSLQTCAQLLSHQEGGDSPFSHTHAHHHFHHHHCPIASCFPSGAFPCFACSQICHHQHRQTQPPVPPPPEERVRSQSSAFPSMYPCMHCSASFTRPSQLLQHQRSDHTHKAPGFICTECGRTFNSHSNLRIHLNVHTGARPYTCSDCGKSFSQSGALKIHKRIHTGERPYSCAFCGRGFPHLAGLRAHQRTHTGEKPYHCNQCGKCFTQSGALKIHTRIHTGERPFICSICGKGFSNRSGIRFHYRTVHGLVSELNTEAGGSAYRGGPAPAAGGAAGGGSGRGFPPRTFPQPTINLNAPSILDGDSHSAQTSRENPASTSEAGNSGGDGEALLYACEDCGLRFKDAPSRNRHQTSVHYSSEGREEEVEVETEKHK